MLWRKNYVYFIIAVAIKIQTSILLSWESIGTYKIFYSCTHIHVAIEDSAYPNGESSTAKGLVGFLPLSIPKTTEKLTKERNSFSVVAVRLGNDLSVVIK